MRPVLLRVQVQADDADRIKPNFAFIFVLYHGWIPESNPGFGDFVLYAVLCEEFENAEGFNGRPMKLLHPVYEYLG